jgi:AcrR family transcriptional regulator
MPVVEGSTRDRIVAAAMAAFGTDGFHATSLDALASTLGVTKQTVLHHFGSKDGVLAATTEAAAALLSDAVDNALLKPGNPDERLVRVVHGVFALAAKRPELLGFVRDLSRLGSTPLANLRVAFAPFLSRATAFVEEEMFIRETASITESAQETPNGRGVEALDVVLAAYAAVLAAAAEVEVLRSLGVKPSGRLFLRRRREVIEYLRALAFNAVRPTSLAGRAPSAEGIQ